MKSQQQLDDEEDEKLSGEDWARKYAKRTLALLGGRAAGWKIEVWENIGWYYRAYNGPVSVYSRGWPERFHCMVSSDVDDQMPGDNFGHADGNKEYKDPCTAVIKKIAATKLFQLAEKLRTIFVQTAFDRSLRTRKGRQRATKSKSNVKDRRAVRSGSNRR